ncbi:MAG: hypothetical protein FWH22_01315 [Fibromonadales bacterium]|nr:hypothetical protein [Fibromonadales bacterium]
MIDDSESFGCGCDLVSLCGCCKDENSYNNNWSCNDKDAIPFIKNKIFYNGRCLCASGENPDCVYKYAGDKVIAIEIKDQPEKNIKYDELVDKIKNCYDCACNNGLILVVFILQVSSIKNSSKNESQLLDNCDKGLRMHNFRIGKDEKLLIKDKNFKNTQIMFRVVKCKDFNDKYFNSILTCI